MGDIEACKDALLLMRAAGLSSGHILKGHDKGIHLILRWYKIIYTCFIQISDCISQVSLNGGFLLGIGMIGIPLNINRHENGMKSFLFPRTNSAGKIIAQYTSYIFIPWSKQHISTVACLALVRWPSKTIKNSCSVNKVKRWSVLSSRHYCWDSWLGGYPKPKAQPASVESPFLIWCPTFVAFACLRCDRCQGTSLGEDFGIRPPQLVVRSMQRPVETGCGLWCGLNIHVKYVNMLELWPRLEDFGDSKLAEV